MRAMKDSGIEWIGKIPDNWSVKRVKMAFIRKKEEAHQDEPVVLSLARAGVKVRDLSTGEGQIAESYYNYNPVEIGDFLINPMDLYSGANCSISKIQGVISPAYINLRARKEYDAAYYDYYFKTQYWAMAMFAHGKGVSFDNRWTLNANDLMNYYIPCPTYKEQQKISAYLDRQCGLIDSVIEKTKASVEEYKNLRQAVITQAVTKGVRGDRPMKDSGIEWIGEIPEEWTLTKVRYIGALQNGISKGGDYFGEGFPFVSYGDVYKNYSIPQNVNGLVRTTEDERKQYSVISGDIFFTRTSETIEEVGFSAVCEKTIENATFAGFVIRLRPYEVDSLILTSYAKYYFRGEQIRKYLVKEMNLVTRASLGQGLLNAMSVLIPPMNEQQEIAEYLDKKCTEIDSLISKKEQFLTELEAYKKSLIYEYVTGKKEVPQA